MSAQANDVKSASNDELSESVRELHAAFGAEMSEEDAPRSHLGGGGGELDADASGEPAVSPTAKEIRKGNHSAKGQRVPGDADAVAWINDALDARGPAKAAACDDGGRYGNENWLRQQLDSLATELAEAKEGSGAEAGRLRQQLDSLATELAEANEGSGAEAERLRQQLDSLAAELAEAKAAGEGSGVEAERLRQQLDSLATELAEAKEGSGAEAERLRQQLDLLATELAEAKEGSGAEAERLRQQLDSLAAELLYSQG
ncbi:hypothetical protein KFE25_006477 [Diacronema lutheri]|uniref:Uncharacterized protein n=1 Tax=Diacronema lutheri TaxID=2081491 RepID=A0A8J5XWM9_DIALT|nr:hypothetical protein KFE25_006477 [Diacronema lutheri]